MTLKDLESHFTTLTSELITLNTNIKALLHDRQQDRLIQTEILQALRALAANQALQPPPPQHQTAAAPLPQKAAIQVAGHVVQDRPVSFPQEIIVNILSRLPVKSLLRFRCVCKPWCKLLRSDSDFVKKHLKRATEKNDFKLMLRECYLYSIDYDSSSLTSNEAIEIDYPFKTPKYGVEILGSCNGLLAISPNEDVICIWNPSTKEYKKLPTTPIEFPPDVFVGVRKMSYGFGYNSRTEDYNLVGVVDFFDYGCGVKVYSLRSNSWKSIKLIPYSLTYGRQRGVLVKGALFWIATPINGPEDSKVILSFDLGDERFQEVPQPDSVDAKFHVNVDVFEGCLCLLANLFTVRVDMWVMKHNGVRESWTKMFSIGQPAVIQSFGYVRPIQSLKSGEILLEKDDNAFVLYDPKKKRARALKIRGIPGWFETEAYIGSLVSVNSGTYVGQQIKEATENLKTPEVKKKKTRKRGEVCLRVA